VILDKVVRRALSRAGVVRVRSALNPFLWSVVWSIVFGVFAIVFRDDALAKYFCLVLAALPELAALAVGVGFAVKDPDRLQSEEFVLRKQTLKVVYRRGATAEQVNAAKDIGVIERLSKPRRKGEDP